MHMQESGWLPSDTSNLKYKFQNDTYTGNGISTNTIKDYFLPFPSERINQSSVIPC